jgi:SmpA / OmlA family
MTKRLAFLSVGVGVAVAAGYPTREPLVSEANLSRIKRGMTRAEVQAILGKPQLEFPRTIPSLPPSFVISESMLGASFYRDTGLFCPSSNALVVRFDDNGVVEECCIRPVLPDDRSLRERLRDRVAELRAASTFGGP